MAMVAYILFGAAFTVVASAGVGRVLLRALNFRLTASEVWIFSFLLGAALWSTMMFALAATGLVYKGTIVALGLAAVGFGARCEWPRLQWPGLWMLAAAPFLVLYMANAMAPELSPDGSAYHLGLVSRYYREHGFAAHYENMYAHLSQGVEMLFLSAWAFGRNSSAAMVHFAFQCLVPWMMVSYGRRFQLGAVGPAAALLVYFTPVYGIDGISAYNDVAGAAVVLGVFYLIEIWLAEAREPAEDARFLTAIGLLAGFAFAIKYTLGLAIPYTMVRVGWRLRRVRPVLIVAAAAGVMVTPWILKNVVLTGNPVAPLYNAWFPNGFVSATFEREYRGYMATYGLKSLLEIPREVLVGGKVLNGFLGPVWVLAPLGLLALWDRRGRALLGAAVVFGSFYFSNIGTRFLIPMLPFLALALALTISWLPGKLGIAALMIVVAGHGISSWPDIAKSYSDVYAWRLDRVFWKQALRIESEDGFLRRRMENYAAARMIEEKVPPGEAVLAFNQEAEAYTSREIRTWYQSTANAHLGDVLHTPLMPEARPQRRVELRLAAGVETAGIRLLDLDALSVNEVRLYTGGVELKRAPTWRLRALSSAWFVGAAFDGDLLTRWSKDTAGRGEGVIEIRMPKAMLDRVVIDTSDVEQAQVHVRLQVLDSKGQWRDQACAVDVYAVPTPLGLRRMATRSLTHQGVRWILMPDEGFGAKDLYYQREAWGLAYIGGAPGRKLYRIEDQ